jgi:hypothetical protein
MVPVQRKSSPDRKKGTQQRKILSAAGRTADSKLPVMTLAWGALVSNVQLQLAVISGAGTGKVFPLASGEFVIGRDNAADLHIPDEFVSLRHCMVPVAPGRYVIRDCGSRNGTRLNGERISGSRKLDHGCQIVIRTSARIGRISRYAGATQD